MVKSRNTAKAKGDALESAIQTLEQAILQQSPSYSEDAFRFEAKKIITVAGVRHEIDIWVNVNHGNYYEAIFIFECKNWQEKVSKNDIIVFSEKIKASQAQKGFFVAKSFTSDAKAQAKKDPRIRLLLVRELEYSEVPEAFNHLHVLLQDDQPKAECEIKLAGYDTGHYDVIDVATTELALDGQLLPLQQYLNEWVYEATRIATSRFQSALAPEGVHTLHFEPMTRQFEDGKCMVTGKPVAHIKLSGSVDVRICRAVVESRFEVESRGRVYRKVIKTPLGAFDMSAHELPQNRTSPQQPKV